MWSLPSRERRLTELIGVEADVVPVAVVMKWPKVAGEVVAEESAGGGAFHRRQGGALREERMAGVDEGGDL